MNDTLPPLLPCPFCGKAHTMKLTTAQELAEEGEDDPEPWMHSDSFGVLCDASQPGGPGGCGASGGFFPSEREAVEAWNRRAALAAAVAEPVASVTECEACFTPDVCQLRGTCDHYAAERLRVAAPPQREPLTDEQVDAMYSASYRTRESDYATNWYWYERGIREGERAHGITKEAP